MESGNKDNTLRTRGRARSATPTRLPPRATAQVPGSFLTAAGSPGPAPLLCDHVSRTDVLLASPESPSTPCGHGGFVPRRDQERGLMGPLSDHVYGSAQAERLAPGFSGPPARNPPRDARGSAACTSARPSTSGPVPDPCAPAPSTPSAGPGQPEFPLEVKDRPCLTPRTEAARGE